MQATYTYRAQKRKLVSIMRRAMRERGLTIGDHMIVLAGHWHVCRDGLWVRTTDALNMRVVS